MSCVHDKKVHLHPGSLGKHFYDLKQLAISSQKNKWFCQGPKRAVATQVVFRFIADASERHLRGNHTPSSLAQEGNPPPTDLRKEVGTGKQAAPTPQVKDSDVLSLQSILSNLELCVSELEHSRVLQSSPLPHRVLAQDHYCS